MEKVDCEKSDEAYEKCPWATVIVRQDDGCLCFYDYGEYDKWKASQKSSRASG